MKTTTKSHLPCSVCLASVADGVSTAQWEVVCERGSIKVTSHPACARDATYSGCSCAPTLTLYRTPPPTSPSPSIPSSLSDFVEWGMGEGEICSVEYSSQTVAVGKGCWHVLLLDGPCLYGVMMESERDIDIFTASVQTGEHQGLKRVPRTKSVEADTPLQDDTLLNTSPSSVQVKRPLSLSIRDALYTKGQEALSPSSGQAKQIMDGFPQAPLETEIEMGMGTDRERVQVHDQPVWSTGGSQTWVTF
ncbi:hypothetical protein KIPB_003040 [Kipferlia bialata]|uniref:Uncharacterized protein n=1 Tax=Kipferlia bialata TaxID=797122 RepID=A0A9K3CST2_9EUKA|nr:hypothetical protein KIPB_003040 [Kipferlia bialata]|eukprot:g3040.t1